MKYVLMISYDGSNFFGFQIQKNKRTVQGEILKVLKIIFKESIKLYYSSRTDRGVHAIELVAHFESNQYIKTSNLKFAINNILPSDIKILDININNSNFHSRYDVKKKQYTYVINNHEKNPFLENYSLYVKQKLNIKKMNKGLKIFLGRKNFYFVTTKKTDEKNFEREIYNIKIKSKKGFIYIDIVGDNFMSHMVRMIVANLIEIGKGNKEIKDVEKDLINLKRSEYKVSGNGLYLVKVYY